MLPSYTKRIGWIFSQLSICKGFTVFCVLFCLSQMSFAAEVIVPQGNVRLELEGELVGSFDGVSGIGSENEVIEQKVVDSRGVEVIRKIPGRLKWSDLVLSRPLSTNMDLWSWRKQVEDGDINNARKNGCIILFDDTTRTELGRWCFTNGWPSVIEKSYNPTAGTVAIERITIVHESIVRVQ